MRKRALNKFYGITEDDYEDMMVVQGGVCALCGGVNRTNRLSVDHDHETGKVRGLLCIACNRGLGHIERVGFWHMAEYLGYAID